MSEQGMPLPAGTSVGDCVIQRVLDQDRYGFRYRAESAGRGSVVVHELFPQEFSRRGADGVQIEPFDAEDRVALRWWTRNYLERARQFAALAHPSLLAVLSAFEAHGTACHATPSVNGASLHSLIARQTAIDEARLDRLLADLLGALGAVHEAGLLHRALCPQQIWARDDGSFVIGGFGSLRAPLRFRSRMLHSVMPAPYAAPEESHPEVTLTPAADLYGAAAILWHLIAGQPPPSAEARAQGAQLPALAALAAGRVRDTTVAAVEHALAFDPADRPQSVAEWSRLMRTAGTSALPRLADAPAAQPAQPARRRPSWLLAAAVPALIVLGAGVWWVLRPQGEAAPATTPMAGVATPPAVAADSSLSASSLASAAVLDDVNAASGGTENASSTAARPGEEEEGEGPEPVVATPEPTLAVARTMATPQPTAAPTAVPTPQPLTPGVDAAAAALRRQATPAPRVNPPVGAPVRSEGVEVASLARPALSTPDPVAEARAEQERKRQEHAQQLALERSRCSRNGHVSDLFAGRDFTYADIAKFEDVTKLSDGQLQTPVMRVDDGRRYAFQIDRNGCIVRVVR